MGPQIHVTAPTYHVVGRIPPFLLRSNLYQQCWSPLPPNSIFYLFQFHFSTVFKLIIYPSFAGVICKELHYWLLIITLATRNEWISIWLYQLSKIDQEYYQALLHCTGTQTFWLVMKIQDIALVRALHGPVWIRFC